MTRVDRRTDAHRPSAIVPEEYEHVLSYSLATSDMGWPIPSVGVTCELDRRTETKGPDGSVKVTNGVHAPEGNCCILWLLHVGKVKFAPTGGPGQCAVCGARYVYGDVWRHVPSGEHIHIGHDCADKYQLLAERGDWDARNAQVRRTAAALRIRAENEREREAFYTANPGLREAFEVTPKHDILADLEAKFRAYRTLSPKQVALAIKLATEAKTPRPEEAKVPAPLGKQTFRGILVSLKAYEGDFGTSIKGTIKVSTPDGVWLAWGTVPRGLLDLRPERGDTVEVTATLKPGREAHFALTSRPTKGRIIDRAPKS